MTPGRKAKVAGLRTADGMTLMVLTQDVLRRPLVQLHVQTLSDLLALAECEGLPKPLTRDLARFSEQMFRELRDLPDGGLFEGFLDELAEVDPSHIPDAFRLELAARAEEEALAEGARERLASLVEAFEDTPHDPPQPGTASRKVRVQRADVPDSHKAPDERRRRRTTTRSSSSGGASEGRTRAPTPTSQKDERREQWIREDVLDRLSSYGSTGLKEAILIAGARHRAPFKDLAGDEVTAVLRKLGREGVVKHSAGRWSMKGRW
ncbi:MAG: hypothetical protein H6739_02430 [Alphaproteobacteria bacterium]|nr:hypothetical protein [Alphaproteobacteria bacterium]